MSVDVGPLDSIAHLQREGNILWALVERMLADIESGKERDRELLKYLQEIRQCTMALHTISSGTTKTSEIRQSMIVGNMMDALRELSEGEKASLHVTLEKHIIEAEKCLPNQSKSILIPQELKKERPSTTDS